MKQPTKMKTAKQIKKEAGEKNCKGCKYQEKCAGVIFGTLGFGHNIVATDDKKDRSYCENWKEFNKLAKEVD